MKITHEVMDQVRLVLLLIVIRLPALSIVSFQHLWIVEKITFSGFLCHRVILLISLNTQTLSQILYLPESFGPQLGMVVPFAIAYLKEIQKLPRFMVTRVILAL
jgi:hypothetical protein